jgi:hypothetical protein
MPPVLAAGILAATSPERGTPRGGAAGPRLAWRLDGTAYFVQVALLAPWVYGFPSVATVTLAGVFPLGPAAPAWIGGVAALTLFTGAFVPRIAALRDAGPRAGMLAGLGGLGVGLFAVGADAPWALVPAGVLLGSGHGLVLASCLRWLAGHVPADSRGAAVGVTYAVAYLGFGAPYLLAVAERQVGIVAALAGAAALAAASLVLHEAMARRSAA